MRDLTEPFLGGRSRVLTAECTPCTERFPNLGTTPSPDELAERMWVHRHRLLPVEDAETIAHEAIA